MSYGLTPRQRDVVDFLRDYHAEHRMYPTYDEIGAEIGCRSRSHICYIMAQLEEKGVLTKIPHKARAYRLAEPPTCPHCGGDL